MIILNVLIVILAILLLLLCVPVGADLGYDDGGLRIFVRVWRFTYCVYPRKPKAKKVSAQEQKKTQDPKPKQKKQLPDVTMDEVLAAANAAVHALKKLRFRLYRLKLHFVSAFDDPYRTAMVFGYANAAVQALGLPNHKRADVQLGVDFAGDTCYTDAYVSVTIRIYYIMKLCVCLVRGLIPVWWRRRKRMKIKGNNTAVKGKVA